MWFSYNYSLIKAHSTAADNLVLNFQLYYGMLSRDQFISRVKKHFQTWLQSMGSVLKSLIFRQLLFWEGFYPVNSINMPMDQLITQSANILFILCLAVVLFSSLEEQKNNGVKTCWPMSNWLFWQCYNLT